MVPDKEPATVTLRESARSSATDAVELALPVPDPERLALVADRLSEEFAETAAMVRALPGRPPEAAGYDYQAVAALRSARAAGEHMGEVIRRVLAKLDAQA
jgi:predicted NAD/FAD-dependent oxidoreductase